MTNSAKHVNQSAEDSVKKALNLSESLEKIEKYYNNWADNYEKDVSTEQYQGAQYIAKFFAEVHQKHNAHIGRTNLDILDAGCGTGLVGAALEQYGYTKINGCDLSEKMATIAAKNTVYQDVKSGIDLNQIVAYQPNQFDAVISCGVFTSGHVPPTALTELIKITKKDGLIVLNTRKSYYASSGFGGFYKSLENEGTIQLISHTIAPYIAEEAAHYFAFGVC